MNSLHLSLADRDGFYGFFKQDAACQTEDTEMLDLKEVITLFLGLREELVRLQKDLHRASNLVQSDYNVKLADKVQQLLLTFNDRLRQLEDAQKRHVQRIRNACRTQLADAVVKLAAEHKNYHESLSSKMKMDHEIEVSILREDLQRAKKEAFKREDMISRLKNTVQKQSSLLKKLNAPDLDDNPSHESTMDRLRGELKIKDEQIRTLQISLEELQHKLEQQQAHGHGANANGHHQHHSHHGGSTGDDANGSGGSSNDESANSNAVAELAHAKEIEKVYLMRIKELTEMNKKELARAKKERDRDVREWMNKYEATLESIRAFKEDDKINRILQRQNALLQYATVFFPKRAKGAVVMDPVGQPPDDGSQPMSPLSRRESNIATSNAEGSVPVNIATNGGATANTSGAGPAAAAAFALIASQQERAQPSPSMHATRRLSVVTSTNIRRQSDHEVQLPRIS